MEHVEINVKVNGKEVNLSTISTETFEKVKAAIEIKKIPIARTANLFYKRLEPRVIICTKNRVIAIDLETDKEANSWGLEDDSKNIALYQDVQELK